MVNDADATILSWPIYVMLIANKVSFIINSVILLSQNMTTKIFAFNKFYYFFEIVSLSPQKKINSIKIRMR